MEPKPIQQILAELAEDGVPTAEIDLWPAIRQNLLKDERTTDSQGDQRMENTHRTNRRIPAAVLLAALALIAIIFLAATPQVQSLAQSVLRFFVPAEQNSFPLPVEQGNAGLTEQAPQPTAAPPPGVIIPGEASCSQSDPAAKYSCQVAAGEMELGFQLKAIPVDSELLEFNSIYIEPQAGRAQISYSYRGYLGTMHSVWLLQGEGPRHPDSDWEKVPPEAVQNVRINGMAGEFVAGTFIQRPGEDHAAWNGDVPMARLRWTDGSHWFELFKAGEPELLENAMDRDGMVRLAESLVILAPSGSSSP